MGRWPLVWDLRETPPRSTLLPGHQSALGALALSPNGKLLATGDRNRTLLWDLSVTPLRSTALVGHQENIMEAYVQSRWQAVGLK